MALEKRGMALEKRGMAPRLTPCQNRLGEHKIMMICSYVVAVQICKTARGGLAQLVAFQTLG